MFSVLEEPPSRHMKIELELPANTRLSENRVPQDYSYLPMFLMKLPRPSKYLKTWLSLYFFYEVIRTKYEVKC